LDPQRVRIRRDETPGRLVLQYGDVTYRELVPRRPFPISRPQFIILAEKDGNGVLHEVCALRDYNQLDQESKSILEGILEKTYFMPTILTVEQLETSGDEFQWKVLTDKGPRAFNTRGRRNIIVMGQRIVVIDTSDNIYLIPDYRKLDPRSRRMLYKFV
ncbi:MAG: DUF1854 domain-containing protein, partial [Candidatus Bathyarchaeia archaeon]